MPTIPQLLLAALLALTCAGIGVLAGRVVPLFHPYPPDDPENPDAGPPPPPPPSCPECRAEVAWSRWAPLPARFVLAGRCPACAAAVRAPASVPVLAGVLAAAVVLTGGDRSPLELAAFCFLAVWAVLLGVVDARVKRLPNLLVFPGYPIALVLLGGAALTTPGATDSLVDGLIGLVGLSVFYFVLWFIYPAGMGWGDVKMAGLLGLYLGWETLGAPVSGTFLAFLASAVIGLGLIAVGKATRKSAIPFGPFMLIGAFILILAGDPSPLVFG
ncbi:leader peptidase (prepilin peptidase)/N-methyltransferase [Murinocardiopsis flavida]|uniref:Leader peptidase (Prepilin peptidase)/N-methyltransferase n=1 Tax=Murinocardiopsis flavida TaxID=645275 RepID=A0A2P8DHY8_9ACTN|nr:A24 family peptidase [Murinocardiopsis flavida]PSK96826.1 leader peptidase (prepilin peptidase)/N-methyltransferase [Murinocardiopsis flavida]